MWTNFAVVVFKYIIDASVNINNITKFITTEELLRIAFAPKSFFTLCWIGYVNMLDKGKVQKAKCIINHLSLKKLISKIYFGTY